MHTQARRARETGCRGVHIFRREAEGIHVTSTRRSESIGSRIPSLSVVAGTVRVPVIFESLVRRGHRFAGNGLGKMFGQCRGEECCAFRIEMNFIGLVVLGG